MGGREGAQYQYLWNLEPSSGYYIFLRKGAQISRATLRTMQTVCILLAFLCLGLCLLVAVLLSRSISQPVSALDRAMARVRQGDLSVRIYTNRRDELGRLGESFNRMIRELKENIDMKVQKQKDLNEATRPSSIPIFSTTPWTPSSGMPGFTRTRRFRCWRRIWR